MPPGPAKPSRTNLVSIPPIGESEDWKSALEASSANRESASAFRAVALACAKPPPPFADPALVTGGMRHARSARTPHINARKQEYPDDVDEMPVPGGELEAKMLRRREMSEIGTKQAHDQEDRADDDMRAVKAGRHEESGAVDVAAEIEPGMAVFVGLHASECQTKRDRQDQAPLEPLAVVLQKRVVRPGHGRARGEQDQGVEQRQVPRVEGLGSLWRPHPAKQLF